MKILEYWSMIERIQYNYMKHNLVGPSYKWSH